MQVSEVLRIKGSTLFTATPQTPLSQAVLVMADNDIGSVVVMDQGKLVGMLTFREVIKIIAARHREQGSGPTPPITEITIGAVMNAKPLIAAPDTDVNELRRTMLGSHQRYLPVLDGELLMGVVSFHDVARAVLEEQGFENQMLKAYISDWPSAR